MTTERQAAYIETLLEEAGLSGPETLERCAERGLSHAGLERRAKNDQRSGAAHRLQQGQERPRPGRQLTLGASRSLPPAPTPAPNRKAGENSAKPTLTVISSPECPLGHAA